MSTPVRSRLDSPRLLGAPGPLPYVKVVYGKRSVGAKKSRNIGNGPSSTLPLKGIFVIISESFLLVKLLSNFCDNVGF